MAGLKELRTRIDAIKSTQKITAAMKMVAASRLRRVQILVDKNQGYADNLRKSAKRVIYDIEAEEKEKHIKYMRPTLAQEVKNPHKYVLVVMSSDRGLCGSYNTNAAKKTIARIEELRKNGKEVIVVCWGKKAYDMCEPIVMVKHGHYNTQNKNKKIYLIRNYLMGYIYTRKDEHCG